MISQQAYYTASIPLKLMNKWDVRNIVHALRNKNEMDQTQILNIVGKDQSGVAYILGKMVKCGMLDVRRAGKHKFYKINVYNMREIRNATKTLNGIRLENQ